MADIAFIGLGHMGFPMAPRRRSPIKEHSRRCSRTSGLRSPKPSLDCGKSTLNDEGADSDFTSAGVTVGNFEK
jgi:hypothetical protein